MLLSLIWLTGLCVTVQAESAVVTAHEMLLLLDAFVESCAPEHLDEWKALFPDARKSDTPLLRADGIFALYCAACIAQPEQIEIGDEWMQTAETGAFSINTSLFGEMVEQATPWH